MNIYVKAKKVLESCKNRYHLSAATKYIIRADKHLTEEERSHLALIYHKKNKEIHKDIL